MAWVPRYSEEEVREALESSPSLADALRLLGLRPVGGNYRTLRGLIAHYGLSTAHMDPNWTRRRPPSREAVPLGEILVRNSSYSRGALKHRLYTSGLKRRICELCGQDETWHGRSMALILDHVNGVGDDNRLENLRIVCPNCAATLETHCGRKNRINVGPQACEHCGEEFLPRYSTQRFCSHACGVHCKGPTQPRPERRKVERPAYDVLIEETQRLGFSAVGRKYGVSDNAVRKWIRWYEAAEERRRAGSGEEGASEMG